MLRIAQFAFSNATKKKKPDYLYGLNPVLASLSAQRRQPQSLYLNMVERSERVSSEKIQKIQRMAKARNLKIKYLTKSKLLKFTS